MKRSIFILLVSLCFASVITAQYKVNPNKPYSTLRSGPGYLTINELTGGFGLGGTTAKFSKMFFGFTSVTGYQINKNFIVGAGVGVSFYESGLLVPLFLDFRFAYNVGQLTPYVFADGGLLLNVADLNTTKLFINPGVGARYTLGKKVGINFGAGFLSQVDGTVRETFVNFKLGAVYAF
jgi:hypothetical protein